MASASSVGNRLTWARTAGKWIVRAAIAAALLAIPIRTLQNISIGDVIRQYNYLDQAPLAGQPDSVPITWSPRAFFRRKLQVELTQTVVEAMPIRAFLVRLSNQIRYSLFGVHSPTIVIGAGGQLITKDYVSAYCSRDAKTAERGGRALIPELQRVQAYFRERKRVFVYLISPSKAAHMPEAFIDVMPCPNSPHDRERVLPEMMSQLRTAGIAAVDTATLIHGLKDRYPDVDLFARGGVHWNALGIAHATKALLQEINREAGRQIAPELTWSYVVKRQPVGSDRDVLDLLNLIRPPLDYPVPEVKFRPATPCAESRAPSLKVVMVGNSFSSLLLQSLLPGGCFERLEYYFYLNSRWSGNPLKRLPLEAANIKAIRDADVVILEQNETYFGDNGYMGRFFKEIDW